MLIAANNARWLVVYNYALSVNPEYVHLPVHVLEDIVLAEASFDPTTLPETLLDYLTRTILSHGTDAKKAGEFVYSIMEAVQNAQEHGYHFEKYNADGDINKIQLSFIFTKQQDIVSVTSRGSLDIEKAKKSVSSTENLQLSNRGRGFYIMTKYCDVVYPLAENGMLDILLIKTKTAEKYTDSSSHLPTGHPSQTYINQN